MKPVLVLRHGNDIPLGYLGDSLADGGVPVAEVPLFAGALVPESLDWTAIVSLGGLMGAYDVAAFPYLVAEKRLLARAAAAQVPVLGVCLGCQLLADSLGGRAFLAPKAEAAVTRLQLTEAGVTDPVLSHLKGPVAVWHQDTFEIPPTAELLAHSELYPQAFREGTALGIQPHPEASPEILKEWLNNGGRSWLGERGVDGDSLLAEAEGHRAESEAVARALFDAWVASLG